MTITSQDGRRGAAVAGPVSGGRPEGTVHIGRLLRSELV